MAPAPPAATAANMLTTLTLYGNGSFIPPRTRLWRGSTAAAAAPGRRGRFPVHAQ